MGIFLMAIFTGVPIIVGTILVLVTFRHWIRQARQIDVKDEQ